MSPSENKRAVTVIDHFDRVEIINMTSRLDRRRETEAEFAQHGFPINTEKSRFFPAITPQDAACFPNRGVRGCFLSHLNVLASARDDQLRHILVLEDDISFSSTIKTLGAQAVAALEGVDWDIAYLGHALDNLPGQPEWLPVTSPMLLAHCYAINGRTLTRLVGFLEQVLQRPPGHPEGGPMHYDGALNTFIQQNPQIKAYYFSKNLGYQRPSRTDLHEVSIIDRSLVLRQFAGLYRAAKRAYLKLRR
ncbi:glycosyltransferase family 25 protein [Propionivibrio sp.]|uniref:glycosyltransferase family 25 protein n=1 Tax=Propionivibrio sp. TaxID=2212460 RepID=UPI003BF0378B